LASRRRRRAALPARAAGRRGPTWRGGPAPRRPGRRPGWAAGCGRGRGRAAFRNDEMKERERARSGGHGALLRFLVSLYPRPSSSPPTPPLPKPFTITRSSELIMRIALSYSHGLGARVGGAARASTPLLARHASSAAGQAQGPRHTAAGAASACACCPGGAAGHVHTKASAGGGRRAGALSASAPSLFAATALASAARSGRRSLWAVASAPAAFATEEDLMAAFEGAWTTHIASLEVGRGRGRGRSWRSWRSWLAERREGDGIEGLRRLAPAREERVRMRGTVPPPPRSRGTGPCLGTVPGAASRDLLHNDAMFGSGDAHPCLSGLAARGKQTRAPGSCCRAATTTTTTYLLGAPPPSFTSSLSLSTLPHSPPATSSRTWPPWPTLPRRAP